MQNFAWGCLHVHVAMARAGPIGCDTCMASVTILLSAGRASIPKGKGGVHSSKFSYGDLTWENQSVSKYNALWYVTHILTCEDQSIVPYGQHLDWTLGKFPPIYGPHLLCQCSSKDKNSSQYNFVLIRQLLTSEVRLWSRLLLINHGSIYHPSSASVIHLSKKETHRLFICKF